MQETEFYLVWNECGKSPFHRHSKEEDAKAESERLAIKHPGDKFYIVRALNFAQVPLKPEFHRLAKHSDVF